MNSTAKDLWESSEWRGRREAAHSLELWYEGRPLDETEPRTDPETGKPVKRYPLRLNPMALACDVHRDMARGAIGEDTLFLKAKVSRQGRITSDKANVIEGVINNGVWRVSRGGVLLSEALLCSNIFGGTGFKLSWEPWRRDLTYGLAMRGIRNPSLMHPVWDPVDPWRFMEMWYGYEISAKDALLRYGVDVGGKQEVLYMEHWTEGEFQITIDGKVPRMKLNPDDETGYLLEGENRWGFVPFAYAPHERASRSWGRSQIAGQGDNMREYNARFVNVADSFRHITPGLLYGTDIRVDRIKAKQVHVNGRDITILDLGQTPQIANAKSPALHAIPQPDLPRYYSEFPEGELGAVTQKYNRLSPAVFGEDDTASGRITGVAVAQRMWTTTAHADTERLYMGTAKTVLDADVVKLFGMSDFQSDLQALLSGRRSSVEMPAIEEEDGYGIIIYQSWPDALPIDRMEEHTIALQKLQANAMSVDRFMRNDGVLDVDEEKDLIEEWQERVRPPMMPQFGGI